MQAALAGSLISLLPKVRGEYREQFDLSKTNWFQVGGKAEVFFKPKDTEDLAQFYKEKPAHIPVTIIGVGSNLLVRDGGLKGVVIRLGRAFAEIRVEKDQVIAGAGALCVNVANFAASSGLGGLEFLSGIPGTIGGALRMNAGAYGSDVSQIFESATAVDVAGNIHTLTKADMGFSYRHTEVPVGYIFTEGRFNGVPDAPEKLMQTIKQISARREETQPIRSRTGGSTFKNPEGKKAWQLIDEAHCRGLKMGGAQVSEMHCNFLINTGSATAADIEALGEEVRKRVKEKTGILLEWEIKRIGEPL